jgi:hypothetical protein
MTAKLELDGREHRGVWRTKQSEDHQGWQVQALQSFYRLPRRTKIHRRRGLDCDAPSLKDVHRGWVSIIGPLWM